METQLEQTQLEIWLRRFEEPSEPEDVTNLPLDDLVILIEENEYR